MSHLLCNTGRGNWSETWLSIFAPFAGHFCQSKQLKRNWAGGKRPYRLQHRFPTRQCPALYKIPINPTAILYLETIIFGSSAFVVGRPLLSCRAVRPENLRRQTVPPEFRQTMQHLTGSGFVSRSRHHQTRVFIRTHHDLCSRNLHFSRSARSKIVGHS